MVNGTMTLSSFRRTAVSSSSVQVNSSVERSLGEVAPPSSLSLMLAYVNYRPYRLLTERGLPFLCSRRVIVRHDGESVGVTLSDGRRTIKA